MIISITDESAPLKEICIRNSNQEWMDEEVLKGVRIRDKLLSKFKRTKSHTDHVNFRKARNNILPLIKNKKTCVVGLAYRQAKRIKEKPKITGTTFKTRQTLKDLPKNGWQELFR